MKPTESKLGGGGKTGKRPWSRPRIREMAIGARTRGGPKGDRYETATYNPSDICDTFPQRCQTYGVS